MIHATGKVAATIVDGLKTQPIALPLVVVNVVCLVVVGYTLYKVAQRAEARDALVLELATKCATGVPIPIPKGT